MRNRTGFRWSLLLLPVVFLAVSCGVPISAEEVTATAESQKASQQLTILGEAAVSSQAAAVDARFSGLVTPSPVSTLSALSTGTPGSIATPDASATPGPSTTPGATVTGTVSASPEASGTPSAGLLAASSPAATPEASPAVSPTVQAPSSDMVAQVVNLVNEYRQKNGLSRLAPDPYITTAAGNYAKYMGTSNFFGHTGLDGSSPQSRMASAGFAGCYWGEAINGGQTTAQQSVDTWKSSKDHNAILLAPDAVYIGVGYYYDASSTYKHYWVLMTGRPEAGCVLN